ncbi:hypothetical protein EH223_18150 [candidate division KSB1 bacterium]|nr:pilus assembly protein PilM [candidate division KSB1 bacterium]RQW00667.1 MAG: hypothetical protein EH223_18150 [candidate division KSB1 bacterium]
MVKEIVKLGISIGHDKLFFVEAEEWNGKINVTSLVQVALPKSFDFTIIGDQEYIPQISKLIDSSLDNFSKAISGANVCIDRRLALKKHFAVDKGLADSDVRKHIEWELEQLLVAPRDEYNVDFVHNTYYDSKKDIVVFAALRKAIIIFVREIFQKSRLAINMLDLDLFASIRALNAAHADHLSGATALIEFAPAGVNITCLLDGHYAISKELPTTIDGKKFDSLPIDELVLLINNELQKLTENVEENLRAVEVGRVFLGGEIPDKFILDEFQKIRPDVTLQRVDPFRDVHKQLNIESQKLIDDHGEQFISCLGMIL